MWKSHLRLTKRKNAFYDGLIEGRGAAWVSTFYYFCFLLLLVDASSKSSKGHNRHQAPQLTHKMRKSTRPAVLVIAIDEMNHGATVYCGLCGVTWSFSSIIKCALRMRPLLDKK